MRLTVTVLSVLVVAALIFVVASLMHTTDLPFLLPRL